MHEEIVRRTGGKQGFVSRSNLACVLETTRDIGEGLREDRTIISKSGHLLFDLIYLHPFLDGNKRTAFEVAKNFMRLNGWVFEPDEGDAFGMVVSFSKSELDAESAMKWIARNLSKAEAQK